MTSLPKNILLLAKLSILLIVNGVLISGCISTEPRSTAPHINLSPQTMFVSDHPSNGRQVDFGLEVSANESDSLESLEVLPGLRVRGVSNNSPAQAADIKSGDIILAVNATETNHPDTLTSILQKAEAGQEMVIKGRRDTTVYETTMVGRTLVQSDMKEVYRSDPVLTRAGYQTELITADGKQLTVARIVELFPKSPFPQNNIVPGDAILAVNNQPVESAQGLINQLHTFHPGDKVTLSLINANQTFSEKQVRLWDPGRRISQLSLWPLFSYQSGLSPSTTKFSILDFWFFSIFEYARENTEKSYRLLTFFSFGSGAGELLEGSNAE